MKNKFLNLLIALVFCCFGVQNTFANITSPAAAGSYACNGDGTVQVTIQTTYTSATNEWLDCASFTFPAGWEYVSSVATSGGADLSTVGSNVAAFGNANFCPAGDSDFGPMGGSPDNFIFNMTPPAGFDFGDCNTAGDGDPISFTWTYAGDGYGEATGSSPGTNGDATTQTDLGDTGPSVPPPPCNAGAIPAGTQTEYMLCAGESFEMPAPENDTIPDGGEAQIFFTPVDAAGNTVGTGALGGAFVLPGTLVSYPQTIDISLTGILPANNFPNFGGTWFAAYAVEDANGDLCSVGEFFTVTFLPSDDPSCEPIICNAGEFPADFPTAVSLCPGEVFVFEPINDTIPDGGDLVFAFSDTSATGVGTGTGGATGGFTIGGNVYPNSIDPDVGGILSGNGFPEMGGTWYITPLVEGPDGVICAVGPTVDITFLVAGDAGCEPPVTACNIGEFPADLVTEDVLCDGEQYVYPAPMNDTIPTGGELVFIYSDTSATGVGTGTGGLAGGIFISGVSYPYTTDSDANGTLSGNDIPMLGGTWYIFPVIFDAAGAACAVGPEVTLTFAPAQPIAVATGGDCETSGAVIGYDNGDGAGGAADGDLDDPEDVIISTLTSGGPIYPCTATASTSDTDLTLAAADIEAALGLAAGTGCYTDITVTSACDVAICPPCDATPSVLSGGNVTCSDGSTGSSPLSEDTAGVGGTNEYIVTDADGSVTGTADVIINVGSFQEAQDAITGLAAGESVCVTAMTYDQPGLDQIVADLNTCTGGLAGTLLGLPTTGNTFEIVYEAIVAFSAPDDPGLTIAGVEALIGGGGGGPGLGGEADLSALLPGLACPVAPFCYRLSNTVCAVDAPECPPDEGCTDPCATNYDPNVLVDDGSCILPTEPATECWETATFNTTTCVWDVTGDQPAEPATACYETATFNDVTCVWDVTGDQPAEPATACYETATFNDVTCVWDVTGDMPAEPTTACYETAAFNDVTCVWDVTGDMPAEPATECYETATFNDGTCVWDVTGDMPAEPTTECYQTATFNDATCVWDVTGDMPPIDDSCDITTDSFDDATCMAVNTPNCPAATPNFDAATCTCTADPVMGCTDSAACNYDPNADTDDGSCVFPPVEPATECYETATLDNATCAWVITGEQDPEPATECYQTAAFDDATCAWVVTGEQDAEPTGLACYETAAFDDATCAWVVSGEMPTVDDGCDVTDDSFDDVNCVAVNTPNCPANTTYSAANCECTTDIVMGCTDECATNYDPAATEDDGSCTLPAEPTTACYETATFNTVTCVWDVTGDMPTVDDGCDVTDDSFDDVNCVAVNTPNCPANTTYSAANCECTTDIVMGCTDECATNYDPAATEDDGSCTLPAEPTTACYETATFNTVTCVWDVTGDQPAEPATECYETATFDDATCAWNVSGDMPTVDDGCDVTDDSFDDVNCVAVNTPNCPAGTMYVAASCECMADPVPGCTNPAACNYDAAANTDNGSCTLPGDSCNDGNPLTTNDVWNADCTVCAGTDSGEAIPTVGEWGLIILALILLNLGVLYIRQTEIKIVSE